MNHMLWSSRLEDWYEQNKRELPWRDTCDPYLIWIAEIILQQTRVAQGYDYYVRFVRRFPCVEDLARAEEDEVLKYWQGLGYYSRARNLYAAARQIVEMGGFPRSYELIRSLKGVGDYTAAAIASFAFDLPYAVLDGNVYRVLSRCFGVEIPIDSVQGKKYFAALAQELLDERNPALYNQAIMDFGALQCTPVCSEQKCLTCPMNEFCVAHSTRRVNELPVKARKTAVTDRYLTYVYVRCQNKTFLHRRQGNGIWRGLYEPPVVESDSKLTPAELISQAPLSELMRCSESRLIVLKEDVTHRLSHRLLHADFYLLELDDIDYVKKILCSNDYVQLEETDRDGYAVPKLLTLMWELL